MVSDSRKNLVQVLDTEGQILFSCPVEEEEKAFEYARQMEELGIEVKLSSPSVSETLIQSLGASEEDTQKLREEIIHEIEEHDTGCCNEKPEDEKLH